MHLASSCSRRTVTKLLVLLLAGWTKPVFAQQHPSPLQEPIQIPLHYDGLLYPAPVILVRLNGTPLPFILDTGTSTPLVIDTWAAKQLHLSPGGSQAQNATAAKAREESGLRSVEVAGKLAPGAQEILLRITPGKTEISDLQMPEDLSSATHIAGLVGISFFASWTPQFDFAKQTLTLLPPAERPLRIREATTLPLKRIDTRFLVTAKSRTGGPVDFLVDTGCPWLLLSERVAKQFQFVPTPFIQNSAWGVNGIQTGKVALMRTLSLGDVTEPNLPTLLQDRGRHLLGMSFLARFRVTLDMQHNAMLLERSADYAGRTRPPGLPSVLVLKQNEDFVVYDLLPDSAAAKAGVHIGDAVTRVDGRDLSDLSYAGVQSLLDGYEGVPAEIVIKGAEKQPIRYTRQSMFAMANGRGIGVGIGVTLSDKGELTIATVDARSPAQEAGLKAGDQIVAINGLPVRTTAMVRLAAEMKRPVGTEIRLQVLQLGSAAPQEYRMVIRKLL